MSSYVYRKVLVEAPSYALKKQIVSDLTFHNPEYDKKVSTGRWVGKTPKEVCLYEYNGSNVYVPFGYAPRLKQLGEKVYIDKRAIPDTSVDYKSEIKLFGYQEKAVRRALEAKQGILVAPCGSGKTQMALEIIARLGHKALWITHTSDLLEQSEDRAKACFGIDGTKFGRIAAGKTNVSDGLTFATVQTMANIDLDEYKDAWDVIVVDECHRAVGSIHNLMMFYKVLSRLAARYKFGVTATPKRADGMFGTTEAIIGPVFHEVMDSEISSVTCPVRVEWGFTDWKPKSSEFLNPDGTLNYVSLIDSCVACESRNRQIVEDVLSVVGESPVLVLTERVAHRDALANAMASEASVVLIGCSNTKAGKNERREAILGLKNGTYQIGVATYAIAKEGLDIPPLRHVFMATPLKNEISVIQSAGRVKRAFDGKRFGVVHDYRDEFGMLISWARKREGMYKKL